jgi:hypothetical protein
MNVPDRGRYLRRAPRQYGILAVPCPWCLASAGTRCHIGSYDDDGNWYEVRRLKNPHPARKDAYRRQRDGG